MELTTQPSGVKDRHVGGPSGIPASREDPMESIDLDNETRLVERFSGGRLRGVLAVFNVARGKGPPVPVGLVGATNKQDAARLFYGHSRAQVRLTVGDPTTGRATRPSAAAIVPRLQGRRATATESGFAGIREH